MGHNSAKHSLIIMWHIFEAESADSLWREVVKRLQTGEGILRQPSRAGHTREVLHAALTIRDPRQRWVFSRRPAMNPAFAIAELVWIVAGRRDARFLSYFNHSLHRFAGSAEEFHGSYGYRLRHQFGFDQLDAAYQALKCNPETRQVVLQIWDPRADMPTSSGQARDPDIPCNTQSQLKVREGKLEWLQIMRSNDVFLGLPHNLIQFTALQEIIAGWLGLELGQYHHISDSLHIYERDLDIVSSAPVAQTPASDSLCLSKSESERAFNLMTSAIERIIDEKHSSTTLLELSREVSLPSGYHNMLLILVAEGLRRRKSIDLAAQVASGCTSLALSSMWSEWTARLISKNKLA